MNKEIHPKNGNQIGKRQAKFRLQLQVAKDQHHNTEKAIQTLKSRMATFALQIVKT